VPHCSTDNGSDGHNSEKMLRKARRQMKRSRKPKRTRDRSWTTYVPEAYDDLDLSGDERIVPKGERERRRAALTAIPTHLAGENLSVRDTTEGWHRGTVISIGSALCEVSSVGCSLTCSVRGSLSAHTRGYTNVVAVGDEVLFSDAEAGRGVIEHVQPRRTRLSRPDVFYPHLQQVIVANADQLLIVCSLRDPAVWFELIDRYLVAAVHGRLEPIICLNKVDLAHDEKEPSQSMAPYVAIGYEVIYTSVVTSQGLDQLSEVLRGRGTVLAGLSGVGKSSLLNGVQPGLQLRTGQVSNRHHEGRHTTVQASQIPLASGGYVVDTPGSREFGLWGVSPDEIASYFPELSARAADCRYARCSHLHEPDCAVIDAVHRGEIFASRYESYVKIRG
jgi:ribosome biogenesis GTPase